MSEHEHRGAALTRALRAMGEEDERLGASAQVEARLLVEAHAIVRARRRRAYAGAGTLVAVLLAAILVPPWQAVTRRPLPVDPAGLLPSSAVAAGGEMTTEFFPLMYSNVPITNGQTVRLELPQAALASFGFEAGDSAGDASATVLADVVVGQDGLARAVRFVRPATNAKEQNQ